MGKKSKGFNELLKLQELSPEVPVVGKKAQTVKVSSPQANALARSERNFEEQERRIGAIVGVDEEGHVKAVNKDTLAIYQNYLQTHLEMPCQVTGMEDFQWEEYYILGPGSKQEHDRLRKTKPSYLDTYELLEFKKGINQWDGLIVSVKRISDRQKFDLPLSDLEATDNLSKNFQFFDDYSVWFVNWR
jgi:hypothetical protein